MTPESLLDNQIRRLRKRVRLLLVERYLLLGGAAGAVTAAMMVLLSSRYDALLDCNLWAGAVAAGLAAGAAFGLLRRLDNLTLAIAADRRTQMKERLSTAVALKRSGASREMEEALITDAGEHISRLRSRDVFRHRFGLPHIIFGAGLALLLCAIILPQLGALQSKTRRQEVAVMKREGKKLTKLAKDIRTQTDERHETLRKLATKLQKLGWKMQAGRMSKKQAMLQTQRLSKEVRKEQDRLAKENSRAKSMEQAQAQMRKASLELAKRMADEIAKKKNIPPAEALKKMPSDKRLAELARKEGPLTEAERKELSEAVKDYLNPNSNNGIPRELGEALAKLAQNSDMKQAAQLMQQVAQKLSQTDWAKNGEMGKLDRKMMEQLAKAMAQALKDTDLDKLAKQMLKNAKMMAQMSPEELEALANKMNDMKKLRDLLAKAGAG